MILDEAVNHHKENKHAVDHSTKTTSTSANNKQTTSINTNVPSPIRTRCYSEASTANYHHRTPQPPLQQQPPRFRFGEPTPVVGGDGGGGGRLPVLEPLDMSFFDDLGCGGNGGSSGGHSYYYNDDYCGIDDDSALYDDDRQMLYESRATKLDIGSSPADNRSSGLEFDDSCMTSTDHDDSMMRTKSEKRRNSIEDDANIPSANKKAAFRKSFDSATSMVFHSRNGLPLTSSPAPMRRRGGIKFDFDSGISTPKDIKRALFESQYSEASF